VEWAEHAGVVLARAAAHADLLGFVDSVRAAVDGRVRVAVNPPRV
jgi:hypothetical protein